jgi:hypothetical protein
MSTALQLHSETMGDWAVIRQQAEVLVKTGFLPQSIKTPEQAMAIILTGRELGIGAMAALNTINVIQGKPTISPQLMLGLINRSGELEDIKIDTGAQGATCTIKRRGRSAYTARFGPAEAAAMGLNGKDNYKKQAATMYKWRAVADACRATFADVLLGLYTPDEMGATTDVETGEIVETVIVHGVEETEDFPTSKPHGGYHETLPEPEPVRNVKLEGGQPKQQVAGSAGTRQILGLIAGLKWGAEKVRGWMDTDFGYLVETDDLAGFFDSLQNDEQRKIIAALKAAFGGK